MEPEELLQHQVFNNRIQYQQKNVDEASQEQQSTTSIVGYDSTTGLMKLRDGSVGGASRREYRTFYASAITNGAVGKGEATRVRRGNLPTYDAMPFRQKETVQETASELPIVFGILATVDYDTSVAPDDEDIDSLDPLSYFSLFTDSCLDPGFCIRSNFCIGILQPSGKLKIQYLFEETVATWKRYVQYINQVPFVGSFIKSSYYSMFYNGNKLNYIDAGSPSLPGDFIGRYNYAFITTKLVSISINKANPKNSDISEKQIQLGSKTPFEMLPRDPGITTPTYQTLDFRGSPPESVCLKYLAADTIKFVLVSGLLSYSGFDSIQQAGIIVWDLGGINEIESKDNPACYFGFTWALREPNPNNVYGYNYLGAGLRIKGGYGANGGIVLHLTNNSSDINTELFNREFSVFVSKDFLQGENNQQLNVSDIVFDKDMKFYPPPDFTEVSTTVGIMPAPIETKELFYPYSKTQHTANISLRSTRQPSLIKRLMAFTIFNQDKGKEIFS
ncbi:hypothetical protein ACE1AT_11160 [Pelatocladus sp. BLCC-F211]|uniref:hypothetical protein n=1 Tax=Pelatocladus sp. BLCC-F211 TaxID=3342752 RepID=UPI0035BAF620